MYVVLGSQEQEAFPVSRLKTSLKFWNLAQMVSREHDTSYGISKEPLLMIHVTV